MGRSTTSCFKIISCGGSNESVDRDEIDASSENKGPDKRGWSFRKRSARHRVLSNTVVTGTPSSENKETSEPVTIGSEAQVSEKTSDNIWIEEIPRLSNSITKDTTVSTMATKAASEYESKTASGLDESAILVIQAAVRRFLAQRQLVKHKNIIKLQAAVRGHLVRNQAVGTLRCVQAIVKMQALVRARRANLSVEEKGVQNPRINSQPTHVSIEKLLSNSLARQLLESSARTKQINIKCDPSRSDSAWNWLERWMSVSTPETVESLAPEQDQVEAVIPSNHESIDMKSDDGEATVPSEGKENLINAEAQIEVNSIPEKMDFLPDEPMNLNTEAQIEVHSIPEKPDFPPDEPMNLNSKILIEVNSVPEKPVSETESKRAVKRLAVEQGDSEERKSVFGSRKASNPAFLAAQSRFEELSSKSNPMKPVNSSNQDDEASLPANISPSDPFKPADSSNSDKAEGSSADVGSSAFENATQTVDVEPEEYLVSNTSKEVRNGGSECGTELSITSTLDSPYQSDVTNTKFEEEAKVLDEAVGDKNAAISQVEEKLDDSSSEADIELEPNSGHQVYKSSTGIELKHETVCQVSAEASPRSHITVPESQGTPSSQVSTDAKKTRSDKNASSQKRKSWSTSKKSSVDSGLRSSLEQLPKPGKRRNSFGSPRPEHTDQDLPSYMQATQSVRAKALANSSPRSSPDVQDKETHVQKRHSLPGAVNGRQGSPRIQRSMSQALQTTKGNDNRERKWQR